MNNLPIDIIRNIYEYDSTYRDSFDKTLDRKSTRLNSSHSQQSRMPSSA